MLAAMGAKNFAAQARHFPALPTSAVGGGNRFAALRVDPPGCKAGRDVQLKTIQFLALVLTALALVPGGAHLFALANKINLAQDQYFIVQNIYRGWALFGFVLIPAIIANLALALLLSGRGTPFTLALVAFLCLAFTLLIFFVWTYPANQATSNWTTVPAHWEELRRQWEYSHAANALVTFAAFCSVALSVLNTKE
jgi:hypothetical protein